MVASSASLAQYICSVAQMGNLLVEDVLALGLDALDLDGVELGIVVVREIKVGDGVVGAGKLSLNVAGLVRAPHRP